jgi:hypothetical protein
MRPRSSLQADALRDIPLERVAHALGYHRDTRDRARWKRPGSILSVNGAKFYDHLTGQGGGGAIDLVLHARNCSFLEALDILARLAPPCSTSDHTAFRKRLDPATWPTAMEYLSGHRCLDPASLAACFRKRILGADRRANVVFVARDADRRPTGAELLGTRHGHTFRGMAPGSRKATGGFWIARHKAPSSAVIVESALDALSAFELPCMQEIDLFISTAGLAARIPPWINAFRLQEIACGYDADPPGDRAAERLIRTNTNLRRIRPNGQKDWNDLLKARKRTKLQKSAPTNEHNEPEPGNTSESHT